MDTNQDGLATMSGFLAGLRHFSVLLQQHGLVVVQNAEQKKEVDQATRTVEVLSSGVRDLIEDIEEDLNSSEKFNGEPQSKSK
mmetsp:Transcript_25067/g.49339  ORF Transcript_25067/g.49339 Transcript_25067/m.49339 type:complete len:83 (-) Transcript_25067:120-368(-)